MIKSLVRSLCATPPFDWCVRLMDLLPEGRGDFLRVLTYHRIDEVESRPDLDPTLISATPGQFAAQIGWLSRDCDLVSLDDVLAAIDGRAALPKRALLLTFDDAYSGFETHAWPVLRRHAAPAAVFVPTGFPDDPRRAFWWDRLYCALTRSEKMDRVESPFGCHMLTGPRARMGVFRRLKRLVKSLPQSDLDRAVEDICSQGDARPPESAVMGWGQLRRLAEEGVALVPHTHTHPLLDRIPLQAARDEVRLSRLTLQEKIGPVRPAFAYPSGRFSEGVAAAVREEGFRLAFTTARGINDLRSSDSVKLRRTNVGRHTPDALVRFQLTAISRLFNRPIPKSPTGPIPPRGSGPRAKARRAFRRETPQE